MFACRGAITAIHPDNSLSREMETARLGRSLLDLPFLQPLAATIMLSVTRTQLLFHLKSTKIGEN